MEKVIIFGVGAYCKKRLSEFANIGVVAFLDNRKLEENESLNGIPIYHPEDIQKIEFDKICIMTGYNHAQEIYKQLLGLGVSEDKIFRNDRDFFRAREQKDIRLSGKHPGENDHVILVPNMFSSGGVRAALYATMALKMLGKNVTVISPSNGEMEDEFNKNGADVIVSSDISEANSQLWNFMKTRKVIIANGLYFSYLISELDKLENSKVVWWLHSGKSFYSIYYSKNDFREIKHVKVFGVSSIVCNDFRTQTGIGKIGILPFGIPYESNTNSEEGDKIVFALIGAVMPVKGLDIFIEAIKNIPEELRSRAKFYIVGAYMEKAYVSKVKNLAKGIKEIVFTGHLPHEKVIELMSKIDVVVSASREDMLPITSIEAFMNEKMCIIPDNIGTVDYVEDGISAKIYQSGSTKELSSEMVWCIKNPAQVERMKKAGKKVYDDWFSMEAFSNNLRKAMEE